MAHSRSSSSDLYVTKPHVHTQNTRTGRMVLGLCTIIGAFIWLVFPLWSTPDATIPPTETRATPSYIPAPAFRTPKRSLTAILPVTKDSVHQLDTLLLPFISSTTSLAEVIIICPEEMIHASRRILQRVVAASGEHDHPEFSLRARPGNSYDQASGSIHLVDQAKTEWALILDENGLQSLDQRQKCTFLNPPAVDAPFGIRGASSTSNSSQWHLRPPFIAPTPSLSLEWAGLDQQTVFVVDREQAVVDWCDRVPPALALATPVKVVPPYAGVIAFIVYMQSGQPYHFAAAACKLAHQGNDVRALIYSEAPSKLPTACAGRISYEFGDPVELLIRMEYTPDVIFVPTDYNSRLSSLLREAQYIQTTVIKIPYDDLKHSAWIGSLTLVELKNWNVPRIDLSIITMDRPRSFARLVSSLKEAKYFGDDLSLRVNLEQSADMKTLAMVSSLDWSHGSVFVHHRVIEGGLLPAVVESWYPHSNHTYGLLLEDDVELSPLFYAWAKATILRYRYGDTSNHSPTLFGISLYQQKNIELLPTGRRPFNAQDVFSGMAHAFPSTPYLSQIPCSWGAVYFPEHWREFHTFLAVRLSEHTFPISQIVVPDVRSNRWVKSWKKFFIELVYLRGYVMLYPNYDDFVSLSTNHLEVGSHVKDRSKEKKDMFLLPLMKLGESERLVDLPGGTLPQWNALPVLNLTGSVRSLVLLKEEGMARREVLFNCSRPTGSAHDVRDLMCI